VTRRLVVTVCPREPGVVTMPVARGGPAVRLDAAAVAHQLEALAAARGLADRVRVQQGCAGGCHGPGPNVGVTVFPVPPPGEKPDHVAIGWRSYVASLATLDCLAAVIEQNLPDAAAAAPRARRRRAR
jgi:hypothetical protein